MDNPLDPVQLHFRLVELERKLVEHLADTSVQEQVTSAGETIDKIIGVINYLISRVRDLEDGMEAQRDPAGIGQRQYNSDDRDAGEPGSRGTDLSVVSVKTGTIQ